ncbi:MAG: DUF1553 domain-containing protein, partial [Planctomycetales bacterium]
TRTRLGWAITEQTGTTQAAIFETQADVECAAESQLIFTLRQEHGSRRTIGRFRLSVTNASRPVRVHTAELPQEIRRTLNVPPARRSPEDQRRLAEHYAVHVLDEGRALRDRLSELKLSLDRIKHQMNGVLTVETAPPRPIRVLRRGDWQDETGELVPPGFPAALPRPELPDRRATRLDLAEWLVSPEHPLTSRVLANRLWKLYFGAGLSRQSDDLGSQGEWPTHPELLDWLAARLIDSGWDLKHVIRLIVTSATYRQASHATAEAQARDPENRWLSHQSRIRLDAELIRDNALAVSGLLATQVGGPSVFPHQPEGYWSLLKEIDQQPRIWRPSAGSNLYRRGVYTHWQRQFLHPMLLAFDAPSREECQADRARSNTPMQALVLLNDPTFVEAAQALASRALAEGSSSTHRRLAWLFQTVLSRPPQSAELVELARLLADQSARYRADPLLASNLCQAGQMPPASAEKAVELAAWTSVARVVLNLHDTITRQ